MIIGVPKEIKVRENRVGLVPGGVKQLVQDGHQVIVENNAGLGIGITNDEYIGPERQSWRLLQKFSIKRK